MQDKEPLDFETLAEYLEHPEAAAHAQTRRQLLTSARSRRRADLTARIRRTLRDDPHSVLDEPADDTALTSELRAQLQALRSGRLDAESADDLRKRLQADPRLLREALHDSLAAPPSSVQATSGRHRLIERLRGWFEWRVPAWAAAGAAAVLVVAVALVAPFSGSDDGELRLAAYRDDATMRFTGKDTLPGVGFFTGAQGETQPFAEVELLLRDGVLLMDWPDVAGARGYTVQLLLMESGKQREVAIRQVTVSEAVLEQLQPLAGQRYIWVISGITDDQRRFATRGGFVLQ